MSRPTSRRRPGAAAVVALAALAAGLLVLGGPAAPALAAASRLPSQAEVAEIYPASANDTRGVSDGRLVVAPDSSDADGTPCNGDVGIARAQEGRTARYRTGGPSTDVLPVVLVRTFATPSAARSVLEDFGRRVRACRGSYSRRDAQITRRPVAVPRLGQARFGYAERVRTFGSGSTHTLRIVVQRDRRLVVVEPVRDGTRPGSGQAVRLARLALDTL